MRSRHAARLAWYTARGRSPRGQAASAATAKRRVPARVRRVRVQVRGGGGVGRERRGERLEGERVMALGVRPPAFRERAVSRRLVCLGEFGAPVDLGRIRARRVRVAVGDRVLRAGRARRRRRAVVLARRRLRRRVVVFGDLYHIFGRGSRRARAREESEAYEFAIRQLTRPDGRMVGTRSASPDTVFLTLGFRGQRVVSLKV